MREWSVAQIKRRLGDVTLFPSDFYYDEDFSEWFPLAVLLAKLTAPIPVKVIGRTGARSQRTNLGERKLS
jgi:hypothetical protein